MAVGSSSGATGPMFAEYSCENVLCQTFGYLKDKLTLNDPEAKMTVNDPEANIYVGLRAILLHVHISRWERDDTGPHACVGVREERQSELKDLVL